MQSSDDWTNVPSPAHEQSVDSSSGTDAFSLINANSKLSETSHPSLDATGNMAIPLGSDQASSENVLPVRSAVVDWVQEQSQHDQPSDDATGLQRSHLDTTPPDADQVKQALLNPEDHASRQNNRRPAKKVYDIATLLRLRETQSAVPVMLRVKPEAIAENIFQYMGAATSRRLPTRSRGLSDASNISAAIAESHSHTIPPTARSKHMTQPIRQPYAPPETSILQRHDGFARFLKQHASPPHHRVTAGGRIVPAGPSSPPPMLDFGSLNGLLRDRPATAKSTQKESRSTQSTARAQNPQVPSSMTLGDYLQSQSGSTDGVSVHHASQNTPVQTAIPLSHVPFGYQPVLAPGVFTQASMVPLALFPDGSTLVSYNGMNFRASWNGMNTTMEPMQPLQQAADQQYYPLFYPQGYLNSANYGNIPLPTQASVTSAPLASATNVPRTDGTGSSVPLQQDPQKGDDLSLKTELANLDKHLALYHYDITPAERASLIARRRYLVEEIDRIRLNKEKPKHSIPIIAPPNTGLPAISAAQVISSANGSRNPSQNDRTAKGGTSNKHLSPAAPSFIPRNISNIPSTKFGMRTASQQAKHDQSGMPGSLGGVHSAHTAKGNADISTWASRSDQKASFPRTQRTSHNEESSSSSVLDPSDPAMRVIEYEDIEYAARYLYNGTKDTKTYCTTVAEFQEAIRRVREQARLYGCAGGQSKDPAYDAEQDLWWAICDRDPVPLPSEVPDHVANPRPWNWNDSAFNYRRQGANDAPGPGCEQARNSPRVFGWDPATTDKMKDFVDVSRSYFALKGQLPSVSFRDVAYDRDGSKRDIQSDTAAPNAYAAATERTANRGHSPMPGSQRKEVDSDFESSTFKEMSTSELNVQRTGSATNPQHKPADKESASDTVLQPQGVPRTPKRSRNQRPIEASNIHRTMQTSKPYLPRGHEDPRSKNAETAHNPHCAYVEDYSETPARGDIHLASKGVPTPQKKFKPSKLDMDPGQGSNNDARTEAAVPLCLPDSTSVPGSNWKPTAEELDSIWYHTPLDEVTQKYVDDMKAYTPFKNKQSDGTNHDFHAAKSHRQSSSSSEPVAESKSPWGPEQGIMPTTPRLTNRFESDARAEEYGVAKTAKVNIPSASTIRAPIARKNVNDPFSTGSTMQKPLDSREVNAVNVQGISSSDTHQFLRKMLKSPRYSSAQPMGILSQTSSTLAEKINGNKQPHIKEAEQQSENKGEYASNNHGNVGMSGNRRYANSRPSSSASLAGTNAQLAVGKAQSSLASSTYQAHGYLPQFDGAGKAHTSSVYREQGIQPLPQVRLPSELSYGDSQHVAETSSIQTHNPIPYTTSATYHNSVNFGYDGGRDSPPPKTTNPPRGKQRGRPAFDTMGLTLADFDNERENTNNAWHHGAVEDFFQDLREQELQTIASHQRHQRVNTQSAA